MPHTRVRRPKKPVEAHSQARLPADVLRALLGASQRVGRGFPERARWMADFTNADLASATPATLDGWRWQAIVWALANPPDLEHALLAALSWSPLWNPHSQADTPAPVVRQLHRDLRAYLDRLLADGRVVVKHAAGEPLLERNADGIVTRRVMGSAVMTFFTAVCDALVELGPRLRLCDPPACGKYVAAVGHYRYCSPACSQRVRTRRFEERHGPRRRATYRS